MNVTRLVPPPHALLGLGLAAFFLLSLGVSPVEAMQEQQELGHGLDGREIGTGVVHGVVQWCSVFLVGLPAFVGLVWLPVGRRTDEERSLGGMFARWVWALFGLLTVAGLIEISLYAVRASGDPFGFELLGRALFDTREGDIWLARLVLGLLTALAVSWAARIGRRPIYWLSAACFGGATLITLSLQGHAASEEGFLPLFVDWTHAAAASLWVGGLLGFPLLFFGLLRTKTAEERKMLLLRLVPRFSRVATVAVAVLVVTGVYASLQYVPSLAAITSTYYGRALIMKLGMVVLLFAVGGINLIDRGRGPFDRMVVVELILAAGIFVATGFLSSLAPTDV